MRVARRNRRNSSRSEQISNTRSNCVSSSTRLTLLVTFASLSCLRRECVQACKSSNTPRPPACQDPSTNELLLAELSLQQQSSLYSGEQQRLQNSGHLLPTSTISLAPCSINPCCRLETRSEKSCTLQFQGYPCG